VSVSSLEQIPIRVYRVSELIYGFETPYGMELLATVHWVAQKEINPAQSDEQAVALVHQWSERKHKLFEREHILKAWEWLHSTGWLTRNFEPY
jgi:hypothetical protein